MTQEDKELLFKNLCARLPYGVKVKTTSRESKNRVVHLTKDNVCHLTDGWWSEYKPYFFPLSSMTIEEKHECPFEWSMIDVWIDGKIYLYADEELNIDEIINMFDWLNKNILTRGLIEKGLALNATGKNIY